MWQVLPIVDSQGMFTSSSKFSTSQVILLKMEMAQDLSHLENVTKIVLK
jgi:hypothetical protein